MSGWFFSDTYCFYLKKKICSCKCSSLTPCHGIMIEAVRFVFVWVFLRYIFDVSLANGGQKPQALEEKYSGPFLPPSGGVLDWMNQGMAEWVLLTMWEVC